MLLRQLKLALSASVHHGGNYFFEVYKFLTTTETVGSLIVHG